MAFTSGVSHNSFGTFVAGQREAGTEPSQKIGFILRGLKRLKVPKQTKPHHLIVFKLNLEMVN